MSAKRFMARLEKLHKVGVNDLCLVYTLQSRFVLGFLSNTRISPLYQITLDLDPLLKPRHCMEGRPGGASYL